MERGEQLDPGIRMTGGVTSDKRMTMTSGGQESWRKLDGVPG